MRDPTDLDPGPIVLQRVLDPPFHGAVVAALVHVDEVDHDEAGEVAQAQLARDLVGRLQVGAQRGILDVVLAGGAAGVHVDGDEGLRLVDDEGAARLHVTWLENIASSWASAPALVKIGCVSRHGCTFLAWVGISSRMKSLASR